MAEQSDDALSSEELLALTSEIVAAHVSNNTVAVADLPSLIEQVHKTLAAIGGAGEPAADRPTPAVPIRKSVTPDEYRERWNLPSDYPMVAPNYAKQRSKLAKAIGLGTQQRKRKKR